MVFWEGYVSDEVMGMYAPIAVFWLYAGLFELLSPAEKYRLRTRKETDAKNVASLSTVIKCVLRQQFFQAIIFHLLLFSMKSRSVSVGTEIQPSLLVQIFQIFIALFAFDTWQYFLHRVLHANKFLYRHFHYQHHQLVAPYTIGVFFGHPLEGLFMDIFGGAFGVLVSGMTPRTAVFFFCFATIRGLDVHSGLWFSGNPFQIFCENNSAYHDIHHQLGGMKYNYAPYFTFWDKLLGTHMPYKLIKRPDGGFEPRLLKD